MKEADWPELTEDAQSRWEKNAAFWDDHMGSDGNDFHRLLIWPTTERLPTANPAPTPSNVTISTSTHCQKKPMMP